MALLRSWLCFAGPICFAVLSVIVAVVGLNRGKYSKCYGAKYHCGMWNMNQPETSNSVRAPPPGLFSSYVSFVTPAALRHSDARPSASPACLPWRLFTGRNGSYLEGHQLEDEGWKPDCRQSGRPVCGGEDSELAGQAAERETWSRHTECEARPRGNSVEATEKGCKHMLWEEIWLLLNHRWENTL